MEAAEFIASVVSGPADAMMKHELEQEAEVANLAAKLLAHIVALKQTCLQLESLPYAELKKALPEMREHLDNVGKEIRKDPTDDRSVCLCAEAIASAAKHLDGVFLILMR